MSVKKSKLDLLVRVRYSNPLPAPPCPPKMLEIPTHPSRYARPEFLDVIAHDTAVPMIVDAECGMPLDLAQWECLWQENGDDSALNPDPNNLPLLDPKDEFLLEDPSPSTSGTNGAGPSAMHVSWLRKTEYVRSEHVHRGHAANDKRDHVDIVDVSRDAQIRDIEAAFASCNNPETFDLATLRHPTNPTIHAIESFEVLPDADIWANAYDLFRFSERPGERPIDVEDPRLENALLRPMESEGDHFLAYYLTKDDETAEAFKQTRVTQPEHPEATSFYFVRDYETVKVEQDVPNEFLLVLDNGDGTDEHLPETDANAVQPRGKGAYYKNIERKMTLKKRVEQWQIAHVSRIPIDNEELDERTDLLAEVADPLYTYRLRAEAEQDAEGELDDPPTTNGTNGTAMDTEVVVES